MPLLRQCVMFHQDNTPSLSASWPVPDGVSLIRLTAIGGGGGGGGSRQANTMSGASGGGAGEHVVDRPIAVQPLEVLQIILGAAGVKGLAGYSSGSPRFAQSGGNGGRTTVYVPSSGRTFGIAGGFGGQSGIGGGDNAGGDGGGAMGGLQRAGVAEPSGADGSAGRMNSEWAYNGGPSGGGYWHAGNHAGIPAVRLGGPAPGTGATPGGNQGDPNQSTGGSGASSMFGLGGIGGESGFSITRPAGYGCGSAPPSGSWGAGGGGGGTDSTSLVPFKEGAGNGANGMAGAVLIVWMGPN